MSATFYLFVSGDYNCGVEGFWPDGDAPETGPVGTYWLGVRAERDRLAAALADAQQALAQAEAACCRYTMRAGDRAGTYTTVTWLREDWDALRAALAGSSDAPGEAT